MIESSNRSQRWISDERFKIRATFWPPILVMIRSYHWRHTHVTDNDISWVIDLREVKSHFAGFRKTSLLREFDLGECPLKFCNLVHIRSLSLNYMSINELKNDLDADQPNLKKDELITALFLWMQWRLNSRVDVRGWFDLQVDSIWCRNKTSSFRLKWT